MNVSSADTILIGAALERMGGAQAQALLDQINKALRQYGRDVRFAAIERRRARSASTVSNKTSRRRRKRST